MPEEKKKQPEVIIDRSKWRCGGVHHNHTTRIKNAHGSHATALLNQDGYKCCLGFACNQLGNIPDEDMLCSVSPASLYNPFWEGTCIPYLTSKTGENTLLTKEAMKINDDTGLSRASRETALKSIFAMAGVKLTFKGKYEN